MRCNQAREWPSEVAKSWVEEAWYAWRGSRRTVIYMQCRHLEENVLLICSTASMRRQLGACAFRIRCLTMAFKTMPNQLRMTLRVSENTMEETK